MQCVVQCQCVCVCVCVPVEEGATAPARRTQGRQSHALKLVSRLHASWTPNGLDDPHSLKHQSSLR